jgi:hypothetical protein
LIHGLCILSDKKIARGKVFVWLNKMWIHCSKCLGPFCHATDFWRIRKCYISYEFVHIANISKTRMDEWNTRSQLLKGGLKYSRLCKVNIFN